MSDSDLLARYNYDSFVPEKFEPWLNFAASPPLGQSIADFPLWRLDEDVTNRRRDKERLDYRNSDRETFDKGLGRSESKAVREFRDAFG